MGSLVVSGTQLSICCVRFMSFKTIKVESEFISFK